MHNFNRRAVFWLWLPLAISFTLMMLEGPTVQSALARLDDPALSLAAFGMIFGLLLIIESPVIMFVSTAIALVNDAQSYRLMRSFVWGINAALTVITGVIAWSPLYNLITGHLLGMPEPIVAAGRPAMQLMLFWIAAIGWRRFYQGILVRHGQTRLVSIGTAIRLISSIVAAIVLVMWGRLSGANTGAIILVAGVTAEAVATHLMALRTVREQVLPAPAAQVPLTLRRIAAFHTPLAATSLLSFLVQPVTAAALARLAAPRETLAAWPVVFSILLILRGWGLAIQDTTIAQVKEPRMRRPLHDFTLIVAGATSFAALLLAFTPLLDLYLHHVIGLLPELRGHVRTGVQISLLLPAISTLTSWLRGLLVAAGATGRVYRGMMINLGAHSVILLLGVLGHFPGVVVGALALSLASLAEYGYLRRSPDITHLQGDQPRDTTEPGATTRPHLAPPTRSFARVGDEG